MNTFQDIEPQVKLAVEQSRNIYMMNREQIFIFLADLAAISDAITDKLRDIDVAMGKVAMTVHAEHAGEKVTAAMMELYVKSAASEYAAEKEWGKNQLSLMNSLRIAALAAQRSSE